MRWVHPEKGVLTPYAFLTVAEESGLSSSSASRSSRRCAPRIASTPALPGHGERQRVRCAARAPRLGARASSTPCGATTSTRTASCIEVTETAVLSLLDSVRDDLVGLRALGMGLHVDDFGTGYSSIALLRDLPVTGLKLDRRSSRAHDRRQPGQRAVVGPRRRSRAACTCTASPRASRPRSRPRSCGARLAATARATSSAVRSRTRSSLDAVGQSTVASRTLPTWCSPRPRGAPRRPRSSAGRGRRRARSARLDERPDLAPTAAQIAAFSATGRARSVVARTEARLASSRPRSSSALVPPCSPITTSRPPVASVEVAGEVGRAHVVEDDVGPAAVGGARAPLDEVVARGS